MNDKNMVIRHIIASKEIGDRLITLELWGNVSRLDDVEYWVNNESKTNNQGGGSSWGSLKEAEACYDSH